MRFKIIDQRDPERQERLHPGETAAALGFSSDANLGHPLGISGVSMRNPGEAEETVQRLRKEASRMRREWAMAQSPGNVDRGKGGSGLPYPIAIVLSNYGATIVCDNRRSRVKYFQ